MKKSSNSLGCRPKGLDDGGPVLGAQSLVFADPEHGTLNISIPNQSHAFMYRTQLKKNVASLKEKQATWVP